MKEQTYEEMRKDIDSISPSVIKDLEKDLREYLDKCGLFYKVFSRIKKSNSVIEKLESPKHKNIAEYMLQDLVGIRIVLYFKKDIFLCEKIISQQFAILNISKDEEETDKFHPQRINYVCALPENIVDNFDSKIWEYPIDKSFEIQIRTIFSEGWHEIEHDFRYKCLKDWDGHPDLSRTLNGVLATLENCDWAIDSLLAQVAYRHYKNKEWIPMFKNVFQIRIADTNDMDDILNYLDSNIEVAKLFFRLNREEFLLWLSETKGRIPLKLSTLVFLANYYFVKNSYLTQITPKALLDDLTPDCEPGIVKDRQG